MNHEQKQPELVSVGHLCVVLQQVPAGIRAAAKALDLQPWLLIDGVPHYSGEQVEQFRDYFADKPLTIKAKNTNDAAILQRRGYRVEKG